MNRGPGRPAGADGAATRSMILQAAREVVIERGYAATTFQAVADRAGLSRPSLHHYFTSREQMFAELVAETETVIAGCAARARRYSTIAERLSAFVGGLQEYHRQDATVSAFLVTARLEVQRHPALGDGGAPTVRRFLAEVVSDAIERGELGRHTEVGPVIDMLHAIMWGFGFLSGVADPYADVRTIARQLERVFSAGLLAGAGSVGSAGSGQTRTTTRREVS